MRTKQDKINTWIREGSNRIVRFGNLTLDGNQAWSYAEPLATIDRENRIVTVVEATGAYSQTSKRHFNMLRVGAAMCGFAERSV